MRFPSFLKIAVLADVIGEGINRTYGTANRYYRIGARLTDLLSKAIGFKYELLPAVDGEFGRLLPDGNWTGMIGMVHRGEVDMAISEIAITDSRRTVVQYSYPFSIIDVTFISQRLDYFSDLTTVLEPFSFEIWIGFLICHLMMPLVIYAFFYRGYSFQVVFFKTFGTFFGQPVFRSTRKRSQQFLVLSWIIGMMFLSHIYKAHLLSTLTFPTLRGVKHIMELSAEIERGNYECATYAGSYYADALSISPDKSLQIIGRNLKKNRGSSDIEEVLQSYPKHAFIGPKPDFLHLKNKYFVSDDIFFSELPSIPMSKGFCCKDKFDETIFRINAGGLYKKLLEDESFNLIRENLAELAYSKIESVTPLAVSDFQSVFLFAGVGYAIALIVFFVEIAAFKLQRNKKRIKLTRFKIRHTVKENLISKQISKITAYQEQYKLPRKK